MPERQSKPGAVRVRRFCLEDVDAVMQVLFESPEAAMWTREGLVEATDEAGSLALVAESDEEITAFLIGRRVADQAEVLNLAVSPGHRRQHQGTVLLQAALENFRAHGAASVYLEVRESNTAAIAFYEHHGFAKTGRRKDYYQDPVESALTMGKRLG